MNYAWIVTLPLFLSPQSEPKPAQCQNACPGACEPGACEKARAAIEKAISVTRNATQNGMHKTHEAITEAHKRLEQALHAVQTSGWRGTESLKALDLAAHVQAYTIGKDGQLAQLQSAQNLRELAERLQSSQDLRAAQGKDEADEADETDMGDEAAEEAEVAAAEASTEATEAGELAQVEASEYLQRVIEKLHKGQDWRTTAGAPAAASEGQSRELEERITALEHRLGVRRDGSNGSLEERVAALERLAPVIATPGRAWMRTPGTAHGGVAGLPSAPEIPVPAMKDEEAAELWEQAATPHPGTPPAVGATVPPPAPPRAAMAPREIRVFRGSLAPLAAEAPRKEPRDVHGLGYTGSGGRGLRGHALLFAPDHRREVEERMQKMRAEMERLREEMTRLREELGRGSNGAR